ncbi:MAG: DUF7673 family protein [Chloroflexota bacterium]
MDNFNNDDMSHRLRLQLGDIERRRSAVKINGIPALQRLMEIAQGDTGQARIVGRFLLGLYNSDAFPFPLADLRGLDLDIWDDCMAVLALDQFPEKEIHMILPNGPEVFDRLRDRWGGA